MIMVTITVVTMIKDDVNDDDDDDHDEDLIEARKDEFGMQKLKLQENLKWPTVSSIAMLLQ